MAAPRPNDASAPCPNDDGEDEEALLRSAVARSEDVCGGLRGRWAAAAGMLALVGMSVVALHGWRAAPAVARVAVPAALGLDYQPDEASPSSAAAFAKLQAELAALRKVDSLQNTALQEELKALRKENKQLNQEVDKQEAVINNFDDSEVKVVKESAWRNSEDPSQSEDSSEDGTAKQDRKKHAEDVIATWNAAASQDEATCVGEDHRVDGMCATSSCNKSGAVYFECFQKTCRHAILDPQCAAGNGKQAYDGQQNETWCWNGLKVSFCKAASYGKWNQPVPSTQAKCNEPDYRGVGGECDTQECNKAGNAFFMCLDGQCVHGIRDVDCIMALEHHRVSYDAMQDDTWCYNKSKVSYCKSWGGGGTRTGSVGR